MKQLLFHGTSSESKGLNIIQEGIRPDLSETQGLARPVDGRVYLATNIKESLPYLLGGAMAGHDLPEAWIKESRYGFMFVIDREQLQDIQPDEDQVGQAISESKISWGSKYFSILSQQEPLQEEDEEFSHYNSLLDQVKDGDYSSWIKAGHLLLPLLTDSEKMDVIKLYGNVAHLGVVQPQEAWKFDKTLSSKLKEDGSNFFDLAERVL